MRVPRVGSAGVTPDERWLAAVWPFVRSWLPASPARVVEIGCGPLGGFVPMLRAAGYNAAGVDPQAPEGGGYCRVEFERYEQPGPADAVVACTDLVTWIPRRCLTPRSPFCWLMTWQVSNRHLTQVIHRPALQTLARSRSWAERPSGACRPGDAGLGVPLE